MKGKGYVKESASIYVLNFRFSLWAHVMKKELSTSATSRDEIIFHSQLKLILSLEHIWYAYLLHYVHN